MRSPIYFGQLFRLPQEISLHFLLLALLTLQIILCISISLFIPVPDFLAQLNPNIEKAIWLCIIGVILAAIWIIIINHWVTKPILQLKIAAKKMASGDMEQNIKMAGVSEVKELAASFNSMAKQLQILLADLMTLNSDLSQNERRLIQFLEALPLGVSVQDTEGNIVYNNQAARRLTGKHIITLESIDEFTATYEIYQVGTNQLYPTEQLPFMRALRGEVVAVEDLEIRNNGKAIPLEVQAKPIFNDQGNIIHAIVTLQDISERKKAEEALAASQRFIETITDTTPNLLYIIDSIQQRFIYLNQQYAKFFGRSPEEIKQSTIFFIEVTHPDDLIKLSEIYQQLNQVQNEEIVESEFRVKNVDGEWRWLHTRDVVFSRSSDGLVEQILGTAIDVTVAKEMEAARMQAEQEIHFQASLLNAVHQAVIVTDLSGKIIYWNRYAETMYGWTEQEALRNSIIELVPAPSLQEQASEIMTQLLSGNSWIGEFWVQRRDGTVFPCIVIDSPIYNEQGEIAGIIGVSIDISDRVLAEEELKRTKAELEVRVAQRTVELIEANRQLQHELNQRQQAEIALQEELLERKRAEAALQQSEALFRSLSESAPIGIFKTDAQGNCVYANPRCQSISGIKMEEAFGNGWMQSIHPEDLNFLLSQWQESKVKEQELTVEIRYCHGDGLVRFGRTKIAPIISKTGKTIGQVGTIEDITESRAIEQMKSEFISIVSHELRTPLASIRGSLGLVAAGVLNDDAKAAREMLEIAAIEADRLVRLVNDILDLERLQLNKVTLDKQWCNAHNLMQQSVQALRPIAEESQVTIQLEPISMEIWADPDRIIQTLINLLSNSIKFSPPKSIVKLAVQEQSDKVLFQIKDSGRGIPADKLETIFGRFQQVDASDSRTKGGTGLGLAICRNIVQQHGGKIWVESVLGEGSTFYFTLPLPWE